MYIGIHHLSSEQCPGRSQDNSGSARSVSGDSFLNTAKKIFSAYAAAPAQDTGQAATPRFKKLKETSKHYKKRTEEDAIRDIEKLLRRIGKSKKSAMHT